jgi:hypothetical protein
MDIQDVQDGNKSHILDILNIHVDSFPLCYLGFSLIQEG